MKKIKIGNTDLLGTPIVLVCMRMNRLSLEEAVAVIETVNESGIDYYDHADIYGKGECEELFAQALTQSSVKREDIILQSKCGIRDGFFDFSKEHIVASVEGSLKRLQTDYLDVLLLHRPDTLVEPVEVAAAFDELEKSGKVRYFGVSNQNPLQVEFLQKHLSQKLVANQLQFGIKHTGMIDQGIHVNMEDEGSIDHDGSILDYSRLKEMTIQAWSPYQYGFFEGVFIGNEKFPILNQTMEKIAQNHGVTSTTLATAWILRHPAKMQVIAGSMNRERLKEIAQAVEVDLSRQEWYEIYRAAGNILP